MYKRQLGNLPALSVMGTGGMRLPCDANGTVDLDRMQEMIDFLIESGVNYFDSAFGYHEGQSEGAFGHCLKKHDRSRFHMATKIPPWNFDTEEGLKDIFQKQLDRLQMAYLDFSLIHALGRDMWEKMKRLNAHEFQHRMRQEGKIGYIGFSFHDNSKALEQILNEGQWDFVQLAMDYTSWSGDIQNCYRILEERGIPCMIMTPLRGGALARLPEKLQTPFKKMDPNASPASWAMRWAASLPGVAVVLSGVNSMKECRENTSLFKPFEPFNEEEQQACQKVVALAESFQGTPCNTCRYCMPCPAGVDIPGMFWIYNDLKKFEDVNMAKWRYGGEFTAERLADKCTGCEQCMEKCPQKIDIPKELKQVHETFTEIKKASE